MPWNIRILVFLVLVLANSQLLWAADTNTPPCTCGSNVRVYLDTRTTGVRARPTAEPTWCDKQGRDLLTAAYSKTRKVPTGFLPDTEIDFAQILAIYWVDHPSPTRIVGSYRMSSTLSSADTLDEARSTVQAFLAASVAKDVVYPHLGRAEIVEQREHRLFFEFQFPADLPSRRVAFRIWKSSFLKPTTGWLLADADRTGSMHIGTVPKNIDAKVFVLFLVLFWWVFCGCSVLGFFFSF